MIKITERGWPGHFICADRCFFRRNTLIEYGELKIVVSTVGSMRDAKGTLDTVGAFGRYYETMAFMGKQEGKYIEADVGIQLDFAADWSITADSPEQLPCDVDNRANAMHDAVVQEFVSRIKAGEWKERTK